MGSGTASGFITPPQKGVIVQEGENFPHIPEGMLRMSPDELQKASAILQRRIDLETEGVFSNPETIEGLQDAHTLCEFALVAVERKLALRGKERQN